MGHNPGRAARQILLSDRLDFLLRVRCCGTRHYRVEDVIKAFGDLAVIGMEVHLHCEVCGDNQWLRAGLTCLRRRSARESGCAGLCGST